MTDFSMSIDTRELDDMLKALPEKVAKKYVQKALQASGDVILAPMVALAPENTSETTPDSNSLPPGILKADLHTQVIMAADGGKVRVGPTSISGAVARWQNNGWAVTGHAPGKKKIKDKPGKFFMQGAYDEAGEASVNTFIASLKDSIEGGTE